MQNFDPDQYLKRIGIDERLPPTDETLHRIHRNHVFHVPFENLDIHFKKRFSLNLPEIYEKVVVNQRGGFCYELNLLFNALLMSLGFNTRLIAAQIVNHDGSLGPPFDHLCLCVETGRKYLADVGYGDLFITPLEISEEIQTDTKNTFRIEGYGNGYSLSMLLDTQVFQKKYIFTLNEASPENFDQICLAKQTHADSYFVKNTICTKPTLTGRVTILNNKLIESTIAGKNETPILNSNELQMHLKNHFKIAISEHML